MPQFEKKILLLEVMSGLLYTKKNSQIETQF